MERDPIALSSTRCIETGLRIATLLTSNSGDAGMSGLAIALVSDVAATCSADRAGRFGAPLLLAPPVDPYRRSDLRAQRQSSLDHALEIDTSESDQTAKPDPRI